MLWHRDDVARSFLLADELGKAAPALNLGAADLAELVLIEQAFDLLQVVRSGFADPFPGCGLFKAAHEGVNPFFFLAGSGCLAEEVMVQKLSLLGLCGLLPAILRGDVEGVPISLALCVEVQVRLDFSNHLVCDHLPGN
ncbi:hypothetical protein D3C77_94490 [compost metagenome]